MGGVSTILTFGMTAAQFRTNVLCPLLPTAMSCSNIISNLQAVPEDLKPKGFYTFINASQTGIVAPTMDNTKTNFCPGTTSGVVYAQIFYAMPVFSPTWKLVGSVQWNNSTVHFVNAAATFKNEPFSVSKPPSC